MLPCAGTQDIMATNNQAKSFLLYRSETNKVIAGIAGGLGEYFHLDPTIIRVIFILLTIFGGWGLLIYIILWILIPAKSHLGEPSADHISQNVEELKTKAQELASDIRATSSDSKPRFWLGILLLVFGVFFLISSLNLVSFIDFAKIWPLLLIVFGIMILLKRN